MLTFWLVCGLLLSLAFAAARVGLLDALLEVAEAMLRPTDEAGR